MQQCPNQHWWHTDQEGVEEKKEEKKLVDVA